MPQLYTDIGPMLLQYKNANAIGRQAMLLDAMAEVEKLSGVVKSKDDAKEHYKKLAYAATLINYADVLRRMENQQYFDILFDFYKMDLDEELQEWFEFGNPGQMRLTHPISEYTPEIWQQFRAAQKAHLIKTNKTHLFDLDQLDILNPPATQLYPIQIQMLGKLENEAVDRICADAQGRIRFAKRFGLYLLPGGGMVEITNSARIDELKHKMLEEHLEEEHANLHIKAAELYDQLDKEAFNAALLRAFESKQAKSLAPEFQDWLKQQIDEEGNNSVRLQAIVAELDHQIEVIKAVEPSSREEQGRKQAMLKSLVELRAIVQVQTFELTPLFEEAFAYVKENTKHVDIQQYLDTRALGGSQLSHSFIMTGMPLEDWFKAKFNGVEGEFGDDIAGSEIERLTLLEGLEQFRKVKFSHLLIGLANYDECLDNGTLLVENIWNVEQFENARTAIHTEASNLLKTHGELLPEIQALLTKAVSGLQDKKKQEEIRDHMTAFLRTVEYAHDSQAVHTAYVQFAQHCRETLDGKHPNILKTILTIAAVSVATVLAGAVGFGIGFALGLWTGPGAFFTGVMAGSAAASLTLAAAGTVGVTAGVLTGYSLFKPKADVSAVKQTLDVVEDTFDRMDSLAI
ncbi:hypothetical protein [Legionella oakridgensis]|uniref:hypothetical protein n=1 Tax=Legionella oakridgensis TaxID=29423 RepID=UPI0003DE0FDB|nr:hypothetical protein [Legionella oakridgensis]ETO93982.1 hypothetical protein LOR_6c00110 [Legionella oakridgensis RV-2-2007]